MENGLKLFQNDMFNLAVKLDNGEWVFDAERVAKCLGFTETKNDKEYIRWRTINGYLKFSQDIAKGDFIPESAVYKLAFKANNKIAEDFQDWLAVDVLPKLRQTGNYKMHNIEEPKSQPKVLETLNVAKFIADDLNVSKTSKVKMYKQVCENEGINSNFLPDYVDEKVGKSATSLLKKFNIPMDTRKFNRLMAGHGFLEKRQRTSTNKSGHKSYNVLVGEGLKYGKNEISTRGSSSQSQPLYYEDKFPELMDFLKFSKEVM